MSAESPQAPPPQAVLMQMSLGYMVPFLLRTAAQLRLADHLAGGARTAEQLAAATSTHAPSLYRLLRTLAANGVFSEDQLHRFSLTPLAEPLRSDVPGSVRTSILSITGDLFVVPWSKLVYSVQTGQSAFDEYFGAPFFDHLTRHPDEAAWFSDLLIGLNSADPPAVAAAYDFSSFAHVADIGGGTGHLLATVLASHQGPRGTLFDLPHSQASAEALITSRGLADRISFIPGSFFDAVPGGCDLYLLSHIIHDWSEQQCLTILGNCRRAMSPTTRLLIIEMVLSQGNAFHPGKMLDMTMLATTPGQERTEPEYRALLDQAHFRLTRVIPTSSAVSIIEAIPG